MYLVCTLKEYVARFKRLGSMELSQWMRLEEDMRDLADWDLTPAQRIDTIKRMRATHAFLLPQASDKLLSL